MVNLFKKNLAFLKEKTGKTYDDIALQLNCSANTISYWVNKDFEPKMSQLELLAKYFEITIEMLLYEDLQIVNLNENEGVKKSDENVNLNVNHRVNLNATNEQKQVKTPKVISLMPKVVTVDSRGEDNMVLVPVKAAAGYLNGYGDQAFIQTLPAYRLPGYNNGIYRMFEVAGLSMHPTLNDGDLLITRSVETIDGIVNDRIHVVVTLNDGIVVKRVLNRVQTDNKLILKSDNIKDKHEYPNMVIDPTEVREIWFVVAFISRIMKSPTEMYERMIDLEGRLTILEYNQKKSRQ